MPEQHHDANQQATPRTSKKAAKNAAAIALKNRRTEQMNASALATRRLREAVREVKKIIGQRHVLESHLDGFYSEVDKLAKGRAMLEVTPFVLEQANEIIRDAKSIITQDVHLDRIKEFVAAGNNPVYPDVLVAMRAIQQSLRRAKGTLEERRNRIHDRLIKAETIAAALQAYFSEDDPDAVPMKQDVEARINKLEDACFYEAEDGEEYFDFDFLDAKNLGEYFSEDVDEEDVSEDSEDDESGINLDNELLTDSEENDE